MRSAILVIAQDTPPPLIVSDPRRHNFGEIPGTDCCLDADWKPSRATYRSRHRTQFVSWVLGSFTMPPPLDCGCALCILEPRLLSALATTNAEMIRELIPESSRRNEICCAADLVSHVKTLSANTESDGFLRELLNGRSLDPNFIDSVLILAFLPMLHVVVRRVARQQACLPTEDITQQTLSILLQYLRSAELCARQSHFAFAISRAVKRKIFEWAQREGRGNGTSHPGPVFLDALVEDDSFERHSLLRHFLHRCVTKRLITDSELNLLIRSEER